MVNAMVPSRAQMVFTGVAVGVPVVDQHLERVLVEEVSGHFTCSH